MDATGKVTVLQEAIRSAHEEILQQKNAILKIVMGVSAVAGVISALVFRIPVGIGVDARLAVEVGLLQLEFFFALFVLSLAAGVAVAGGYVAELERRLNEAAGDELLFWESVVVPNSFKRMGAQYMALAFIYGYVILFFIGLVLLIVMEIHSQYGNVAAVIAGAVGGAEFAILGLSAWDATRARERGCPARQRE